jgi:4-hydroxybenzoate polyprenyltransferase
MNTEDSERFRSWQKTTIDQLGYTINLFLTFGVAALGYCFALLRGTDFPESSARCLMSLTLITLGLSLLSGVLCTLNRLADFRGTARRIRQDAGVPSKEELRIVGRITWCLLYIEVITFCAGVGLLGVVMLLTYGHKLK